MEIDFQWLIDVFAAFYDFFVGIAVFFNHTPDEIFSLAEGAGFTYTWFNPFSNQVVEGLHRSGPVTDAILLWLPYQDKALWYNLLLVMPTVYVSYFIIRGIFQVIRGFIPI